MKNQRFWTFFGVGERVRTSAALKEPYRFSKPAPSASWVHLHLLISLYIKRPVICLKTFTVFIGAEGGIRTHGTLQTHANFQDWCHKPTRPPLHFFATTCLSNKIYINIYKALLSRINKKKAKFLLRTI